MSQNVTFWIALAITGVVLHLFPYRESRVAILRLSRELQKETTLQNEIHKNCNVVTASEDNFAERYFIEGFAPPAAHAQETMRCKVAVAYTSTHRFFLRNHWHFTIQLMKESGEPFWVRSFPVEFPRPLCLLPLLGFLLALGMGRRGWNLPSVLGAYVFLMAGGNLIYATEISLSNSLRLVQTDVSFLGLALILLWLALTRANRAALNEFKPKTQKDLWLSRLGEWSLGLWNPVAYTALGRLMFPFKIALPRLGALLDSQFVLACLSLYLLSAEFGSVDELWDRSLQLPRYFTFATIILFLFHSVKRPKRQALLTQMPHIGRAAMAVLLVEIFSFAFPQLRAIRTLVRVGIALVASELIYPIGISVPQVLRTYLPWLGYLFIGFFCSAVSYSAGLTDLALGMWDPQLHPTGRVLFTFLAGLFLGFLTGNFSATFFALFTFLLKSRGVPLVRAALLDGVLAGSLLSPFSLYNLMPSVQFDIKLGEILSFRLQQLLYPLVIAVTIYTVSAVNSVSILQPVTFVFMMLVVLAYELSKSHWNLIRPEEPTLTAES